MSNTKRITLAAALLAATALASTAASAASIVALSGGKTLTMIDPATRKATKTVEITGAELIGIDVRPADGMLYGVTTAGAIVVVDAATGKLTEKSKLSQTLKPGLAATVDFNPVADRLRLILSDGTNLRVNVDDGKAVVDGALKFAETDMHKGEKPNVVAGSYTNSMKGAKETVLYDIDATIGGLLKQAPPNDGVLNAVGKLGVKIEGPVAFNIVAKGEKNEAWLAAGGMLYAVDLSSGKATGAGKIEGVKGAVTDIAWWE